MHIALDATYSLDRNLSGVGVYSLEVLFGLCSLPLPRQYVAQPVFRLRQLGFQADSLAVFRRGGIEASPGCEKIGQSAVNGGP